MIEIRLDLIDSTNLYAKKHSATFPPDRITCITANEQTAGRGRYQRTWTSPKDVNLYITFYFRLPLKTAQFTTLGQILACSLVSVLMKQGLDPQIKWPNDIQLNKKKLSGILAETIFGSEELEMILGIGINVNMEDKDLAQIDQPATSLKKETGKKWDREKLLKELQNQFLKDLKNFQENGFAPFHSLFEKKLARKGETIRCFDGKREWVGICHSITADGGLNLLLPDQTIHTLISGDVLSDS